MTEETVVVPWADLPPGVVHTLRVLLDRGAYSAEHVAWVESGARAILNSWDATEDIKQLKRDLGLQIPKRRRLLTVLAETEIVAAIVNAALTGNPDPKRTAGDALQANERRVQRAWKAWGPFYLQRLKVMELQASAEQRTSIAAALTLLGHPDKK